MITVIVTFRLPDGFGPDQYAEMAEEASPRFQGVPGLLRKNFIYGEDGEDGIGGGVYTWRDRASAEAFYTDAWRATLKTNFGAEPEVRTFDTPVIVDNETGGVKVAA